MSDEITAATDTAKARGSRFDLHSHTRASDGVGTPEEIAKCAKEAGLDGLCLTDHHANVDPEIERVCDALRGVGVVPIVGVEYSTMQGHLLIYGVTVEPKAWGMYPEMQDVIDDVNALGGVCVVPHAYKGYTKCLRDGVKKIRGLAAVESINGQVEVRDPELNRKARAAAIEMGVPRCGASDAHVPRILGLSYTEFEGTIRDMADFLEAMRSGKFVAKRSKKIYAREASREKERLSAFTTTYRDSYPATLWGYGVSGTSDLPSERVWGRDGKLRDSALQAEMDFRKQTGQDIPEDIAIPSFECEWSPDGSHRFSPDGEIVACEHCGVVEESGSRAPPVAAYRDWVLTGKYEDGESFYVGYVDGGYVDVDAREGDASLVIMYERRAEARDFAKFIAGRTGWKLRVARYGEV